MFRLQAPVAAAGATVYDVFDDDYDEFRNFIDQILLFDNLFVVDAFLVQNMQAGLLASTRLSCWIILLNQRVTCSTFDLGKR